jgi:adenine-specific DNA-methyltransferase
VYQNRHVSRFRTDFLYGSQLKAEVDEEAWASLYGDVSRLFDKPRSGRIAVKVINHLGDEVMKVFSVP